MLRCGALPATNETDPNRGPRRQMSLVFAGALPTCHQTTRHAPWRSLLLWQCAIVLWGLPIATLAQQPRVDFLGLWRTPSEQRAVEVLRRQVIANNADWREVMVSGFSAVKEEFAKRKGTGHPPNVISWPLGHELNAMASNGLTRRISDEYAFFATQLAPELLELVATEHGLSGIPLGHHIQNHVAYNQDILTTYALKRPATWAEFISYGPRLKGDGIYLISNSDEPWQIRNMFMSIVSSLVTKDDIRRVLTGDQSSRVLKDKFAAAIIIFRSLKDFAEPGYHDRKWEHAVRLVERNQALAVLLGDYIIPEFSTATNLSCDLAPGANYILWGADTLAFPVVHDPRLIAGQNLLVKVLADRDTLISFSRQKGSIPAIKNMSAEGMHPCTAYLRKRWEEFPGRALADADSWNRRLAALGHVLSRLWNSETIDIDSAADKIVNVLDAVH